MPALSSLALVGSSPLLACLLPLLAGAQQAGNLTAEAHLPLAVQKCKVSGGCATERAEVTLDANWRWLHSTGAAQNCYTGNAWDKALCPDPATCTANCALDGVSTEAWTGTYGITRTDTGLKLQFVTQGPYSTNIGSRTYLMEDENTYKLFKLKNREFTFDVDVSNLPCGLNGALYFVEMNATGDRSGTNPAGAKYGTGYCDAQCPHDLKFIKGAANSKGWIPNPKDKNSGSGHFGSCCAELDIWEANSVSAAFTAHPCAIEGQLRCEGEQCGDNSAGQRYSGVCDKDGCDFNAFRMLAKGFYGPGSGFELNSEKPFTVVTQFLTEDGTNSGALSEIRRFYVQDGKIIHNPAAATPGVQGMDSIADGFCGAQKRAFGDTDDFRRKGGLQAMGEAMDRGMVLVMSIWDDHNVHMLWLDSDYPLNASASQPGVARGSCPKDSGKPEELETKVPKATVQYANIRYGEIGSTTSTGGMTPPLSATSSNLIVAV